MSENAKFLLMITLIIIGVGIILLEIQSDPNKYNPSFDNNFLPPDHPSSSESEDIKLVANIAQQYSQTHTYVPDDIFDCDNMAQEMWNMLKTKGINSKIVVGNVENSSAFMLQDANHAWIMVELESGNIAVETTGGYLVYEKDNPNYYRGFTFDNPKRFREFLALYRDYTIYMGEYNMQVEYYNRLVDVYNGLNNFDRMRMVSGMQVAEINMNEAGKRANETWKKMESILEN